MRKLALLAQLLIIMALAGCDNSSVTQLKQTIQDQQTTITNLQQQLDAAQEGAIEGVAAAQSNVNWAFVYHHAGPLRLLPMWNDDAIALGDDISDKPLKENTKNGTVTISPALQPSVVAYVALLTLWAVILGALAAIATSSRMIWINIGGSRWARRLKELQLEVAAQEEARAPIADLDAEIRIKQQKLAQAQAELRDVQLQTARERKELDATSRRKTNLTQEIERDKASVLEAFRKDLREQQARDRRTGDAIDKGLADL